MKRPHLFWFFCLTLALPLSFLFLQDNAPIRAESIVPTENGTSRRYIELVPVVDISDFGYQSIQVPADQFSAHESEMTSLGQIHDSRRGGGSDPQNPYAVVRQKGPYFAAPGAVVRFEIVLANYESRSHTFQLSDALPADLRYMPDLSDGLTYEPGTRTLSWQGTLEPGNLDYLIENSPVSLPYLDLAYFGIGNLCDEFVADGKDCDDVTVTFNLGINGYTAGLYGQDLSQLTLSSNGLLLGLRGADSATTDINGYADNWWLPSAPLPGVLLAGLWHDTNMGGATSPASGRWHAAVIHGLIAGYNVFYVQWHDAPHAEDPDLTTRHAIALVLSNEGALAGHGFYIYDNISDPARLVSLGYTIGIGDRPGLRGTTYAYAACCGEPRPPQGYPPAAGTTLHLQPVLFGERNNYRRTFSFAAIVEGQVPETIANTVYVTSNSSEPALADVWATHYLYVRWQTYLPLLRAEGAAP